MKGHVYVIDNGSLVKVGVSVNPDQRIEALERSGGFKCEKRYISEPVEDYYGIELAAHGELSRFRSVGEWFDVDFDTAVSTVEFVSGSVVKQREEKQNPAAVERDDNDLGADSEFAAFQIASMSFISSAPIMLVAMSFYRFYGEISDEKLLGFCNVIAKENNDKFEDIGDLISFVSTTEFSLSDFKE